MLECTVQVRNLFVGWTRPIFYNNQSIIVIMYLCVYTCTCIYMRTLYMYISHGWFYCRDCRKRWVVGFLWATSLWTQYCLRYGLWAIIRKLLTISFANVWGIVGLSLFPDGTREPQCPSVATCSYHLCAGVCSYTHAYILYHCMVYCGWDMKRSWMCLHMDDLITCSCPFVLYKHLSVCFCSSESFEQVYCIFPEDNFTTVLFPFPFLELHNMC